MSDIQILGCHMQIKESTSLLKRLTSELTLKASASQFKSKIDDPLLSLKNRAQELTNPNLPNDIGYLSHALEANAQWISKLREDNEKAEKILEGFSKLTSVLKNDPVKSFALMIAYYHFVKKSNADFFLISTHAKAIKELLTEIEKLLEKNIGEKEALEKSGPISNEDIDSNEMKDLLAEAKTSLGETVNQEAKTPPLFIEDELDLEMTS